MTVDDHVVSINGIPCDEVDETTAVTMVANSSEKVTMVTRHAHTLDVSDRNIVIGPSSQRELDAPNASSVLQVNDVEHASIGSHVDPRFISVSVFKFSSEASLGIQLSSQEGILQVSQVYTAGMLASSPLRAGLNLMAINNKQCKNWDTTYAAERLREAEGEVLPVRR